MDEISEQQLEADLALCEASTQGTWYEDHGELLVAERQPPFIGGPLVHFDDAAWICEAHDKWPHYIRALRDTRRERDEARRQLAACKDGELAERVAACINAHRGGGRMSEKNEISELSDEKIAADLVQFEKWRTARNPHWFPKYLR